MRKLSIGQTFGSLTLIDCESRCYRKVWIAVCSCGGTVEAEAYRFRDGSATRCKKCGDTESGLKRRTFGGLHKGSKEYSTWSNLKTRFNNDKYVFYHRYGGRGITYCDNWDEFEGFLGDMGKAPTKEHSIDRIDNDGNYTKENCRWATPEEQANNNSANIILEYKGRSKTMATWSKELNLNYDMLRTRFESGKYTVEQAFETPSGMANYPHIYTTPEGEFKSMTEVASAYKKRTATLRKRFNDPECAGWIKTNRF